MQENESGRLDLARLGGIKRSRRQILASDPAKVIGASSRIDRLATFFETMGTAFNAALRARQAALPSTGIQGEGADLRQAELERVIENPFASIDAMYDSAIELAGGIKDDRLRLNTLLHVGKSGINGYRLSAAVNADTQLFRLSRVGYGVVEEYEASAKLQREAGHYQQAEDLLRAVGKTPSMQWHLDTAIHKGQRWQQWLPSERKDPNLDPHADLEKARIGLPMHQPIDIPTIVRYAIGHFRATGDDPELWLTRAQEILAIYKNPESLDPRAQFAFGRLAEKLAKAYSVTGRIEEALDVIDRMPENLGSNLLESQIKALAQVANDGLEHGHMYTDRAAERAINAIEKVQGTRKAELLRTVGVDMRVIRAIDAYRKGAEGSVLRSFVMPAMDIAEAVPGLAKSESWRVFARRAWFLGDQFSHHFDASFVALDGINFSTKGWLDKVNKGSFVQSYRDLIGDYVDHGFIEPARDALKRLEMFKSDRGEGAARYAEALADIARAEGIQVRGPQLIDEHIADIDRIFGNESEARLERTGVPVWALIGYYRASGSVAQVAKDYAISMDEANAALAFYKQHKQEIDNRLDRNNA